MQTRDDSPLAAQALDSAPETVAEEGSVDLAAVALVILRAKRTVGWFALGGLLLGLAMALLAHKRFTAEASFLPPSASPNPLSAVASQLTGITGTKNMGDLYVGILQSRAVEDVLIARFQLSKVYSVKRLSEAETILRSRSKFSADLKTSIVTLNVDDEDPVRARDLAAAYLDQLHVENSKLALSEASQRRAFFADQLEKEKNALSDAEVDLAKTEESTGFIAPANQTGMQLGTIAETKAEIAGREVQLASLRQGATDQNPEIVRLVTEINDLKGQLSRLQSSASVGSIPTSKVPTLALENVRKEREVKYHEALFEMLSRQLESARLDEAKNSPLLQVLDLPTVPDKKSWPPRSLIALAGLFFGMALGMAWVLFRERLRSRKEDPEFAARVDELRRAASLR